MVDWFDLLTKLVFLINALTDILLIIYKTEIFWFIKNVKPELHLSFSGYYLTSVLVTERAR